MRRSRKIENIVIEGVPAGGEDNFVTLRTHGEIPDVRLRAARPPRARRAARRDRHGARHEGVGQPLLLPHGHRRAPRDRAHEPRPRPRAAGRLHPADPADARASRGHARHRIPRPARRRGVPPRGGRPLSRRHERGAARRATTWTRSSTCRKGAKRYAGWSTCYRREAGSYGKDTRGIIRVHQFNKLEMFVYTTPEDAEAEHLRLVAMQERMLQDLGLSYRVIDVAAGDLGSSAARKYDVEAWVPDAGRVPRAHRRPRTARPTRRVGSTSVTARPSRAGRQDPARRDAQRHARDHALDRRDARDAPARRRLGRPFPRCCGRTSAASRSWSRRVTEAHLPADRQHQGRQAEEGGEARRAVARDTEDPTVATEQLLIVLDIDGTVLLEDESLSPGVVEAVEHAHRAGHEVMIATGRSWEGTRGILRVLKIAPEFVVCSNGAVVLRRLRRRRAASTSGSTSRRSTPTEVLTLLREHLPDARYMVELPDGHRLYTEYLERLEPRRTPSACRSTSSPRSRCAASSWSRPATARAGLRRPRRAHRPQPGLVRRRLDGLARHRAAGRRQGHRARAACASGSASIPRTCS